MILQKLSFITTAWDLSATICEPILIKLLILCMKYQILVEIGYHLSINLLSFLQSMDLPELPEAEE